MCRIGTIMSAISNRRSQNITVASMLAHGIEFRLFFAMLFLTDLIILFYNIKQYSVKIKQYSAKLFKLLIFNRQTDIINQIFSDKTLQYLMW